MASKGSGVQERVVALLAERYPCQAIPFGALAEIADEVGVSRERVRQIANKRGWDGRIHKATAKVCISCGSPRGRGSNAGLCTDCLWVTKQCQWCGTDIRVRVSEVAWRALHGNGVVPSYERGRFCSKRCPAGPVMFAESLVDGRWRKASNDDDRWVNGVRAASGSRGYSVRTERREDGVYIKRIPRRERVAA